MALKRLFTCILLFNWKGKVCLKLFVQSKKLITEQWNFNMRILIPCLISELYPHTPVYQIIRVQIDKSINVTRIFKYILSKIH